MPSANKRSWRNTTVTTRNRNSKSAVSIVRAISVFVLALACASPLRAQQADAARQQETRKSLKDSRLAGHWQGTLKPVPALALRLALEIKTAPEGTYEGVIVSLDQGGVRIPISTFTEGSTGVVIKIASIGGGFDGKFSVDGSELTGEWQQGGQKLPLTFKRVAQAPTLRRPQEPQKPYPYEEEEVTVENSAAGLKLAGTFTHPKGAGPHPAVVLITGSGPQDRDEAIMGHRPFLVLADHLTRAGIAVLRCDDRGVGKSSGNFAQATHPDFVADALAAVAWLQLRKEIDPRRIGLIGHSEGGIVAPLAAAEKPQDIAFLVLLAGVGVPMDELLVRQGRDIGRVMGASEDMLTKNAAAQRELLPLLKEATDTAAAEKLAQEITAKHLAEYTPEQRQAMGLTEATIARQSKMAASPWFRRLLAHDPRPTLLQVKCPVLAVNGENDLQVAAKENLTAIREALTAGGNTRVKTVEFPGLNHLFQTSATGAITEYGRIEETISPAVLELVADWIREQVGK
jgi:pimeloyl-ACP methyl ester carboxylesterase